MLEDLGSLLSRLRAYHDDYRVKVDGIPVTTVGELRAMLGDEQPLSPDAIPFPMVDGGTSFASTN